MEIAPGKAANGRSGGVRLRAMMCLLYWTLAIEILFAA
jgi:hypothetical protein